MAIKSTLPDAGLTTEPTDRSALIDVIRRRRTIYISSREKFLKGITGFFVHLAQATFHTGVAVATIDSDPKTAADNATKAVSNVITAVKEASVAAGGLALTGETARLAWELIDTTLNRSIAKLTDSLGEFVDADTPESEFDANKVKRTLKGINWTIPLDFFERPTNLSAYQGIRDKMVRSWLREQNIPEARTQTILARLDYEFIYQLHTEWQNRPEYYKQVLDALKTPFSGAMERQWRWVRYDAVLKNAVQKSILNLGESFGLANIYVWPYACSFERTGTQLPTRTYDLLPLPESQGDSQEKPDCKLHIVSLREELKEWVEKGGQKDYLRILCGDPGAGKSSFAQMFAAEIGTQQGIRTVYVPLHLKTFSIHKDFSTALETYLEASKLSKENLLSHDCSDKVLLLLDGLDELAQQNNNLQQVITQFIIDVKDTLAVVNRDERRVLALLGGRTFVIQSIEATFRLPKQVWYLLPYHIDIQQTEVLPAFASLDSSRVESVWESVKEEVAKIDQRDEWWKKYGMATQQPYSAMPPELKSGNRGRLTAQPLLNYLIARLYDGHSLDSQTLTNENAVYDRLIGFIFERVWGEGNQVLADRITQPQFEALLQAIAVVVWHNSDSVAKTTRGTTKNTLLQRLPTHLQTILLKLEPNTEHALFRLLAGFFFNQIESTDQDYAIEFTHKTFGEYLVARQIVSTLVRISKKINEAVTDPRDKWDESNALIELVSLCGPTRIDSDLFSFVNNEISRRYEETPTETEFWQATIVRLIEYVLQWSVPMELVQPPVPNFRESNRQARNVEESLLDMHSICAGSTKKTLPLKWPSHISPLIWLSRLRASEATILAQPLWNYLDLEQTMLFVAYLPGVILEGANLWWSTLSRQKLGQF